MQRISLGALIIALALLVDDAMTTTDATLSRLALGDGKVRGRDICFPNLRVRHAGGHPGDHCRLRAGRLCGKLRGGIHVFALRGGQYRTGRVLVRCSRLCAVVGYPDSETARGGEYRNPRQSVCVLSRIPDFRHASEVADDRTLAGAVRRIHSGAPAHSPAILSVVGSPGATGRYKPPAERVDLCQRNGRAEV